MKLRLSFLSVCATILFASALFTSCTQTNTPPTTTPYTDTWRDMIGLTVGTTYQFNITGGAAGTVITGVSSYATGTVRVFWTRAAGDSSNITVVTNSSAAGAIIWAPASSTAKFKLYETADATSGHYSGLVLAANSTSAPVSAAGTIDAVLATDNTLPLPHLVLVSPDDNRSKVTAGRVTDFGSNPVLVKGGLAADYYSASLAGSIPAGSGSVGAQNIPQTHDSSSLIVQIRTQDNHYARVEIIPQPTTTLNGVAGNYLWVDDATSGKRYVEVNVSYQTNPSTPYAGRPSARVAPGTNRRSAGEPIILN